MTPETRIARHHLGDRLHWIGRGGPHADLWIVQAWPDKGHMMSAQGATVAALHADAAVLIHPGMKPWEHRLNVAEALEVVAEWCAKNLPYHLPPFPGASDAT